MTVYKYKAVNENGEKLEGVYSASSKEGVFEMISSNKYYPVLVEEVREDNMDFSFKNRKKVKSKDIAVFCRQFYTMFEAGLSINNCLGILKDQISNKKLREAVALVEEQVKKGETMAGAMEGMEKIFPPLLVNMIASGEASGTLDQIMFRMSAYYEREDKITSKIKSAMIYPIVLAVVSIVVITFLLIFVMPMFVSMFKESGTDLPGVTKLVLGISGAITNYWYIIILVVGTIVFFIKAYIKSPKGRVNIDKLKLKMPIIKRLNEKLVVSRFTRTLSTLLASGISLIQGLFIVSSIVSNKVAEEAILSIRENMLKGGTLGEEIREKKIFPIMLSSMVSIGEESGQLDEILNKTADFYDEELEREIQNVTALIEPLMIVIMGVVVGILILSIILPMFNMYSIVQ